MSIDHMHRSELRLQVLEQDGVDSNLALVS